MTTYIHYGSDRFYPEYFTPVRNSGWQPKPEGGLWGSREGDEFGWDWWCRDSHFKIEELKHRFRFILPEARILTLEDPEQLKELPLLHPWKPKEPPKVEVGEIPTEEQLHDWFTPNWCYLDYEKLAEEYDAIELRNSGSFREPLPTWDCDCILVMNPEKVRELCRTDTQVT